MTIDTLQMTHDTYMAHDMIYDTLHMMVTWHQTQVGQLVVMRLLRHTLSPLVRPGPEDADLLRQTVTK